MGAKPVIVFRCDASPDMGTGHAMRCLTLAKSLAAGREIVFHCSEETVRTIPAFAQSGFGIAHGDYKGPARWLIVDHYGLDESYERKARAWAEGIVVLDDLADRRHECDILLDQSYGRTAADYKGLAPPECKILAGAAYAILRPEFAALRSSVSRDFSKAERVLVAFGGINPKGSTEFTLGMLDKFSGRRLRIDAVCSSSANSLRDIKAAVDNINEKDFHTVRLLLDTPEMAQLMAQADFCIGAGGTTSWERCCLKLPVLTLELADNQRFILSELDKAGAIHNLGPIEAAGAERFLDAFASLLESPARLQEMSERAAAICDGRGAERLAPYMLEPAITKDGRKISLRPMAAEDCELLYRWQTIPGIRQYARNKQPPEPEAHRRWFADSLENPKRHIFMVECGGSPAGMVRLDQSGEGAIFEVSILIDPQYHGCGAGSAALGLLRALRPDAIFEAEVLKGNAASQKLFEKAGYTAKSDTWYVSGGGRR